MKQAFKVSAIEFCKSQNIHELENSKLQSLPISSYSLLNGGYQVISWYRDREWHFEDARFPSCVKDSNKKICFNSIPRQFIEPVKFALKRYDIKLNPAGSTLCQFFKGLRFFLNYIDKVGIYSTSDITSLLCVNYTKECKKKLSNMTNKPLSKGALVSRFLAVEKFYRLLKDTKWAFSHPWIESSASFLGGHCLQGKKVAATQIIPDKELKALILYCNKVIERASILIKTNAEIEIERSRLIQNSNTKHKANQFINKNLLKPRGYLGLRDFNRQYKEIPYAVAIIILNFSGIRISELCAIQTEAFRIEDNEDDVYHWLKSHSSKTHEGYTEWLVPEIVIKAINIQKEYIKPFQNELCIERSRLYAEDRLSPRVCRIESFKNHLFLMKSFKYGNIINPITDFTVASRIKEIGKKNGIGNLTPHRFRRTFAVYVAQSAYGDLRYLKTHFKHWSMDMTLLYSANESQEGELFNEIALEIKNFKVARVEEFLDDDTVITGGLANKLISYRSKSEVIKTFQSRSDMANKISDTIHIRSTGHSWCTSDNLGCGGRSVIEGTACVDCKESIIEKKRHGDYFKRVYIQQLELRNIDDIGPAGKQRVERDIKRCETVLKKLGMWEQTKNELVVEK